MGRFSGLGAIKSNTGGFYFQPGEYTVQILGVKMAKSRKGTDCFIIETEVLESTNPERPKGCQPSQVIALKSDILQTALSNVKQFAGAALGIDDPDSYVPDGGQDPDDFWEEALEFLVSDEQPAKGAMLGLSCVNIQTKAGNDFTKHFWKPGVDLEAELG